MADNFSDLDHVKELKLEPVKREAYAPWAVFVLIMILPFLSMLAYLIASSVTDSYVDGVDQTFERHMRVEAKGRADALSIWLDKTSKISNRITKSRTVQSFIADVNNNSLPDGTIPEQIQPQVSYIEEVLTTFSRQNNLLGAYLINRRAQDIASSDNAMVLPEDFEERTRVAFTSQSTQYGRARMHGELMVIDMYMPIRMLVTKRNNRAATNVGVLLMTVPLGDELRRVFRPSPLSLDGQTTRVFQKHGKSAALLMFDGDRRGIFTQDATHSDKQYKALWKLYGFEREGKHDLRRIPQFGQASIMPRVGEVLMVREPVEGAPYLIMSVLNLKEAYKDVMVFKRQAQIIAQLLAFIIFILFLSFWWRHQEVRQRALTETYQAFAETVNTQRNLLVSINNAVKEHITLKYFDGHYVYVNPSFAKMLNMKILDVLGKTDKDLFNKKTFEELAKLDKELLKKKNIVYTELSVIINDKRKFFEISKAPFRDASNHFTGIITVSRDITEVVEERILREKALKNSMRALTRIMERHDLHLVKHSRYLNHISKSLGEKMKLSEKDIMTLDICSNLCQLGKVFLEQQLLRTPKSEMNDEMLTTYHAHIEDSAYILDTVDWGLPIVHVVYSMHERLDGSGYPNQLKDEEIKQLPRILGICDTFCELTAPRHGERVYTPEEAIKFMVNEKGVYDLVILQSLAELIAENEEVLMVS